MRNISRFSSALVPLALSVFALGVITLTACGGPRAPTTTAAPETPPPAAEEPALPADGAFVGRIWVSTTPGSARGSIFVFLPDRTMLIASCSESFRLSEWGIAGESIRWIEDSIPIQARVTMQGRDGLRLQIEGMDRARSYVAADVPYTCPDRPE